MARIRTIKPEFWEDEKLAKLPIHARLLFIGTWNFADDNGVLLANPVLMKSHIFPTKILESPQSPNGLVCLWKTGCSYGQPIMARTTL